MPTATWTASRATPLDFDTAASALRSALRSELGADPSNATLALALAKTALETGRWQKMYLWNWGNIKADIRTYPGLYQCYSCNEVLGGKVVWFSPRGRLSGKGGQVVAESYEDPPGHPQTRFRAYTSAADGAQEYVAFQARIKRYAAAWQRLLAGDVEGYVRTLSKAGYFTAPVETYLKTVRSLHSEFLTKLAARPVHVPGFAAAEADTEPAVPHPGGAPTALAGAFSVAEVLTAEALKDMAGED